MGKGNSNSVGEPSRPGGPDGPGGPLVPMFHQFIVKFTEDGNFEGQI